MAKLNAKDVAKELRKAAGNVAQVARRFGVARQSVSEYIESRPSLSAVCKECRETLKDVAESKLQTAIKKGELTAIIFYLKTQAKDRGYVEKTEHEHGGKDGQPITIVEIIRPATLPT